jgi:ABC-2 type transport system ATP-binding protein
MLVVNNLTKNFDGFTAVNNLNFKVEKGEIFGFLGHNGAGKTTTISMLVSLIRPSSGSAEIAGYDVVKDNLKARSMLGYLPENVNLYSNLTAFENLYYFGSLSGVENVEKRIDQVLKDLEMHSWKDTKIREFSKGMRQRIGIAQALLHKPKILFLDEPTSGLDPQGTRSIRDLLLYINNNWNTTIFLNTHLLSEAKKICSSIGILSHGQLLMTDSLINIQKKFGSEKSLEDIYFRIEEDKNNGKNTDYSI